MTALAQAAPAPAGYFEQAIAPLRPVMDAPDTIEVAVNPDGAVWAERAGEATMARTDIHIAGSALALLASQLACGQALSANRPILSGDVMHMGESWRVQIVGKPAAETGYAIALRRNVLTDLSLDDLAGTGAFDRVRIAHAAGERDQIKALFDDGDIAGGLRKAVAARWNILVSGGTSSGKTTMLRALLHEIDPAARFVTIEDGFELRPRHANRVELRASSTGPNTPPALLEASLRLRPDRIILGELRGTEAWSFLEAINTGHPGALTTIHANSPDAAFERLALMAMRASLGLNRTEIIDYARSVLDLVVQVERKDGKRGVAEVMVLGGNALRPETR